jgi:hypothetical protein
MLWCCPSCIATYDVGPAVTLTWLWDYDLLVVSMIWLCLHMFMCLLLFKFSTSFMHHTPPLEEPCLSVFSLLPYTFVSSDGWNSPWRLKPGWPSTPPDPNMAQILRLMMEDLQAARAESQANIVALRQIAQLAARMVRKHQGPDWETSRTQTHLCSPSALNPLMRTTSPAPLRTI